MEKPGREGRQQAVIRGAIIVWVGLIFFAIVAIVLSTLLIHGWSDDDRLSQVGHWPVQVI